VGKLNKNARLALAAAAIAVLAGLYNNCSGPTESKSVESAQDDGCPKASTALQKPATIDDVTNLINALPKPLTLPCFLSNLQRPLKVSSLQSMFSAQPSENAQTPRVFIINGVLVLSVVPTGIGKNLLEMGQLLNSSESVKAELEFPITANIPLSEPFDHIRSGGGTSCIGCHSAERSVAGFSGQAFASTIVRPNFSALIPASQLRQTALTCDANADSYRCAMMRAIFVNGQAQDANFP